MLSLRDRTLGLSSIVNMFFPNSWTHGLRAPLNRNNDDELDDISKRRLRLLLIKLQVALGRMDVECEFVPFNTVFYMK